MQILSSIYSIHFILTDVIICAHFLLGSGSIWTLLSEIKGIFHIGGTCIFIISGQICLNTIKKTSKLTINIVNMIHSNI